MFASVSNFVLSFQLYLFAICLISLYLTLTAIQFQFSVPLLGCCLLKFIYSFLILKEKISQEALNCLSFDILRHTQGTNGAWTFNFYLYLTYFQCSCNSRIINKIGSTIKKQSRISDSNLSQLSVFNYQPDGIYP